MKKRYRSNLDNTKLGNLQIWVKPQDKNYAFLPGLASFGQWSYCSCLCLKKTQPQSCLKQYRSFLFVEQSMLSKLQVSLGCIPAWGTFRKQGILEESKVSHISQHRGGKGSMFGAGPKTDHCMALSWQVKCLSHTYCQMSDFLLLFCKPDLTRGRVRLPACNKSEWWDNSSGT